ncbi:MAG: hypothetical protein HY301_14495 [Verrucomicrobia bacterium]|nr:hypothetical protein [Verrucomicrobiota bacterium]
MKTKLSVIVLFAVALLLGECETKTSAAEQQAGKARSDAEIRTQLIGTWLISATNASGRWVRSEMEIRTNATIVWRGTWGSEQQVTQTMAQEGVWRVQGGDLYSKPTKNVIGKGPPLNEEGSNRVVSISKSALKLLSASGKTNSYARKP